MDRKVQLEHLCSFIEMAQDRYRWTSGRGYNIEFIETAEVEATLEYLGFSTLGWHCQRSTFEFWEACRAGDAEAALGWLEDHLAPG